MLQKMLCCAICSGLIFCLLSCGKKESGSVEKKEVTPAGKRQPKSTKTNLGEKEKKDELIKEKRAELDNMEWQIRVTSLSRKKRKPEVDILKFTGRKVASNKFESKGYLASNYTLKIKSNGTFVWETMQTNERKGVVFWRAEWRGNIMKGIISNNPKRGKKEDFSFISIGSKKIKKDSSE